MSASWRISSPPTWPSCRISTAGSTPRVMPAPPSRARLAATSSPSTCPAAAWGIAVYAADRLQKEVAYLAYHLHWPLDTLLDLEHADRLMYIDHVGRINSRTQR